MSRRRTIFWMEIWFLRWGNLGCKFPVKVGEVSIQINKLADEFYAVNKSVIDE